MDSLYDTAELVAVIRTIRTQPRFFLDRFFRAPPHMSIHEHIIFDKVLEGLPPMAPFVSPVVEAKPQKRAGFTADMFTPAYVKPKHFVKPGDFLRRNPGEDLLGEMSAADRMDMARLDILALQKRQIEARWEWMAAKAIVDAKVTVSGEDYPTVEVDFGRDAENDIVVSGAGNLWSNTDADISGMLEDWSDQLLSKSGYAGSDVIFPPEIWKLVRKNAGLLKEADLRRGVSNIPNLQPQKAYQGVRYVGKWGDFDLWVYSGKFRDQDGSTVRVLDASDVVMIAGPDEQDGAGGVEGIRAYGAIQDKRANLQPIDIFPKNWDEEDPSGEALMSQSAPLMIPGRPDATLKATVIE